VLSRDPVWDASPRVLGQFDAEEMEAKSFHRRVYISRYGSDPIGSWGDRLVTELDRAYVALNEIVAKENER
jgi:hypothetical protein